MNDPVYIAGSGFFLPEERLTNDDLIAILDTSHEWIDGHVGIRERRKAPDDLNTSDLGVRSVGAALERTGWQGTDLELLVCTTSTPDDLTPPTACYIGQKLEIDPVAFDVSAACSGFLYGISVARGLMGAQGYDRAAVCSAEKFTKVTDYTDRASAIFFGDGSATVLLQKERPKVGLEIVDLILANQNEGAHLVITPVGGYFHQKGNQVLGYALAGFVNRSKEMLARNDLAPSDLKAFACHQANLRVLERVEKEIGLTPEQHWHNVEWAGNQGNAGIATTFCGGLEAHADDLRDGDLILLTAYGSGFTSGSVLLRWIDERSAD